VFQTALIDLENTVQHGILRQLMLQCDLSGVQKNRHEGQGFSPKWM
jgi:hypothetical protein